MMDHTYDIAFILEKMQRIKTITTLLFQNRLTISIMKMPI